MDLSAGRMIGDDLNSIVTKKLGTSFTKGANCPEWTKFLQQIFAEDVELTLGNYSALSTPEDTLDRSQRSAIHSLC